MANHGTHREGLESIQTQLELKLPIYHVTWVREPIERALSHFYHVDVSRHHMSSGPQAVIAMFFFLSGSYELNYIRPNYSTVDPQVILEDYDFVGITERMDESLVVLKHILNLPSLCDILYVSAKQSSGPPHVDPQGAVLAPHVPLSEQPESVQHFVASTSFQKKMSPDVNMYAAANAALDKRISEIDVNVFSQELSLFQEVLGTADTECKGPASLTGSNSECYWNDNGCAYECLDQLCARFPDL